MLLLSESDHAQITGLVKMALAGKTPQTGRKEYRMMVMILNLQQQLMVEMVLQEQKMI